MDMVVLEMFSICFIFCFIKIYIGMYVIAKNDIYTIISMIDT